MTEIPEQRPAWLEEDEYGRFHIKKVDDAEAGKSREDELVEALRARFAKAWWEGYGAGVQDTESPYEIQTLNPWETL